MLKMTQNLCTLEQTNRIKQAVSLYEIFEPQNEVIDDPIDEETMLRTTMDAHRGVKRKAKSNMKGRMLDVSLYQPRLLGTLKASYLMNRSIPQ